MAAVDSICELSLRSRHLASRALEYMVDMFNDEIEDVRVKSIESVHKIISKVDLKEEQVLVPLPLFPRPPTTSRLERLPLAVE
jgi:integrator complex subunit 4